MDLALDGRDDPRERRAGARDAAALEELVGAPIDIISTGPDREETILLRHPFGG